MTSPLSWERVAALAAGQAQVIAHNTEQLLIARDAAALVAAAGELLQGLEAAAELLPPVLLPHWHGQAPPESAGPASASWLELVYRRGRLALAAVIAAAGTMTDDLSALGTAWDYAQSHARHLVPPLPPGQADAMLRLEVDAALRAGPRLVPVAPLTDLGIVADVVAALEQLPPGWARLTHDERRRLLLAPAPASAPGRPALPQQSDRWADWPTMQRRLLRLLEGHSPVSIREVMKALYSQKRPDDVDTLLRLVTRTNDALADRAPEWEIQRRGETLTLSPVETADGQK